MKKFLALFLAVIMVVGATVSVSAASGSDPVGLKDLLSYYSNYYSSSKYYPTTGNAFKDWDGDTIYTTWYGSCPKCDGFAFFFVYDGEIRWSCLESSCGKNGVLDSDFEEDTTSKVYCPNCKKASGVYHVDQALDSDTNSIVNTYFCVYCRNLFKGTSSAPIYPDKTPSDITCGKVNCYKNAEFDYYAYEDGTLYAYYECASGHVTKKAVYADYDYDYSDYLYTIRVTTGVGGDYEILGSSKAAYGEKKTIYFEPDYGYTLTDVYVNGNSVDFSDDKITITVKSNTVIRAYFTKTATMKTYKATATASNGGKITATLNGKSVSADSIDAKYTDKIVYRFTPASSNYSVASVKVNGKSVGASNTYTLKNIDSATKIEVTFKWNCPYDDVTSTSKYYAAIEYATEAGILQGSNTSDTLKKVYNFNGSKTVTVKTFACALAEMADVNDKLANNTQRLSWAEKYELVGEEEDTGVVITVKRACEMVDQFLEVLEDKNDISFKGFDRDDTAKENCISIDMVTSSVYKNNRNLTKNDLAAVLYLIANLDYVG